jgi:hypothetical protein
MAPLLVTVLIWPSEIHHFKFSNWIIPGLALIWVTLMALTRIIGYRLENKLFPIHSNFSSTTFHRYGKLHSTKAKNLPLPSELHTTQGELRSNPATTEITKVTVHSKNTSAYPALHQNYLNYGFWRNMVGIKPIGVSLTMLSITLNGYLIYSTYHPFSPVEIGKAVLSIGVSLLFLPFWLVLVRKSLAKRYYQTYATTLFSTAIEKGDDASIKSR